MSAVNRVTNDGGEVHVNRVDLRTICTSPSTTELDYDNSPAGLYDDEELSDAAEELPGEADKPPAGCSNGESEFSSTHQPNYDDELPDGFDCDDCNDGSGDELGDDGLDNADGELPVGAEAGGELPVAGRRTNRRNFRSSPVRELTSEEGEQ